MSGVSAKRSQIVPAHSGALLGLARELFAEYAASIEGVAGASLNQQRFERELAGLPGYFAPPRGSMHVAMVAGGEPGDVAAGCVAMRALRDAIATAAEDEAELKRMYVRPAFRGLGLGRALAQRVIDDARGAGYRVLKLDTSGSMLEAIALYRSLGFVPCARYNADPMEDTLYFELVLRR